VSQILIPPARIPVLDPNGTMSRPWYAFFAEILQSLRNDVDEEAVDFAALAARVTTAEGEVDALQVEDANFFTDHAMVPDAGPQVAALARRLDGFEVDAPRDHAGDIINLQRRVGFLEAEPAFDRAGEMEALRQRVSDLEAMLGASSSGEAQALERRVSDLEISMGFMPALPQITTFGQSLIDDGSASTARTTLGLGLVSTETYTEGSWTPTILGATTAGTQTYSVQVGRYIRIGNLVWATFNITMSAKDAATAGDINIAGLPFTASTITNYLYGANFGSHSNITLTAGYTQLTGRGGSNSTRLALFESGSGVARLPIGAAAIVATTAINGSFVYRIN
jgi:hypothetical protein